METLTPQKRTTSKPKALVLKLMAALMFLSGAGAFAVASETIQAEPVEAAVLEKHGRYHYIWLNKAETRAVANSNWYTGHVIRTIPQPYQTVVKAYSWLLRHKARQYSNEGACLVIGVGPQYGWWVNPIPAFYKYRGGNCR